MNLVKLSEKQKINYDKVGGRNDRQSYLCS